MIKDMRTRLLVMVILFCLFLALALKTGQRVRATFFLHMEGKGQLPPNHWEFQSYIINLLFHVHNK